METNGAEALAKSAIELGTRLVELLASRNMFSREELAELASAMGLSGGTAAEQLVGGSAAAWRGERIARINHLRSSAGSSPKP